MRLNCEQQERAPSKNSIKLASSIYKTSEQKDQSAKKHRPKPNARDSKPASRPEIDVSHTHKRASTKPSLGRGRGPAKHLPRSRSDSAHSKVTVRTSEEGRPKAENGVLNSASEECSPEPQGFSLARDG